MFLNKQAQKFLWVLSPVETKHTSMFYVYSCVQVQVLTLDPDGPPSSVVLQAGVHHSPGVLCFHLWPFPPPSFVHTCSLWGASSQLSLGVLAIVSRSCQISPPPCGRSGHDLPVAFIAVSFSPSSQAGVHYTAEPCTWSRGCEPILTWWHSLSSNPAEKWWCFPYASFPSQLYLIILWVLFFLSTYCCCFT